MSPFSWHFMAIWAPFEPLEKDTQWFTETLSRLSDSEAMICLLELLAAIPEEAANRKAMRIGGINSSISSYICLHKSIVLKDY